MPACQVTEFTLPTLCGRTDHLARRRNAALQRSSERQRSAARADGGASVYPTRLSSNRSTARLQIDRRTQRLRVLSNKCPTTALFEALTAPVTAASCTFRERSHEDPYRLPQQRPVLPGIGHIQQQQPADVPIAEEH